jgi:hypothetical protein
MNSGIAKAIREKWPDVYVPYKRRFDMDLLLIGDVIFVAGVEADENVDTHVRSYTTQLPERLIIANAMTQYDYGRDKDVQYVDYDAVSAAFARIRLVARHTGLPVHFPLIGCGLANGKWPEVAARIETALGPEVEKHLWVLE